VGTKLYIGSLPWSVTGETLQKTFEVYGKVVSAKVVIDHGTGISKGFGFVEMEQSADADNALKALNNSQLSGRNIVVDQARTRD
jgi:cold-inducible RNA-binding protein